MVRNQFEKDNNAGGRKKLRPIAEKTKKAEGARNGKSTGQGTKGNQCY